MSNGHPLAPFEAKIQRLWTIARDNAQNNVTVQVFQFMPAKVQRALVAEQILIIVDGQDEDFDAVKVRALASDLLAANNAFFADEV